ncbi:MAG: hypothetical protein J1F71_03370 [Clostridiales bacterium]|nr:hypothetical protein [Clostridiales bacterium]
MSEKVKKNQADPQSSPANNTEFGFGNTAICSLLSNEAFDVNDELYNKAISAFRHECSVILGFKSPLYITNGFLRQECVKTYIVKALLYIGTPPTGNGLAVVARLTEILTLHPEIDLESVIEDFAKTHDTTVDAVTRIIEKYFNVYDSYFCERVYSLTKSQPLTAKDVLCDISVFVRAKFMCVTRP